MPITRREFVKGSAACAALFPLALESADADPIKTGFLGVAHSHAAEKVKIIRNSPDFVLRGVYAENDELARAYAEVPRLAEKLVLQECDLVIVESAVRDHFKFAKMALEAGKHVHVEKPPALTLSEMETLVRLARKQKRLVQVGYMWRYNPGLVKALEAAREGWLGKVFMVRATINCRA